MKKLIIFLKKIISRILIFINKPNFSSESYYSYSKDVKKLVDNIDNLLSKKIKIFKGN